MTMKTFEDLYESCYDLMRKHNDEETAKVKEMRDAIAQLLKEINGHIQLEKCESCTYNSGNYGKMYITKLALHGDLLMAYCEGETTSLWWNKPVEPWYADYSRYLGIIRQITKRTYSIIHEDPFKERKPEWVLC